MRIVISGGGTGGHIYPALALIREIKKRNEEAEFLYIGTEKGLESKIVPMENIPFRSIHITGFKRKLSFENVKTIYRFLKGTVSSRKILKEFRPDIVIGTGGYVCGPVVYAAAKLGIPTVIHEQNSLPGLTNKFLSRYVDKVAICFEEARSYFPAEKVVLTGNPRASEVLDCNNKDALLTAGLNKDVRTVLVFGGSRGARPLNEAMMKSLTELGRKPYQVLYITGEVHYEEVKKEVALVGNPQNVIIKPFIHNMPEILAEIDLAVTRAGATTLAELTSLGIPAILIPSPYVTDNHQEKNARSLSDHSAALLLLEKELTGPKLISMMDSVILDQARLMEMQTASRKLGIQDAATRLYSLVRELVQ
ncbi:undecaprenyldiphospho-muramoylpentapeptide beta-N-acetylglucosaminyltransferase [Bacillus massilinigeriensis]|uniref:undecaprenyldiphospho-muramoylpentapeptide beta-N-acetylglucosaminyltransferase n=1 Tax=Bacillus mediterraneensis TaxID=1805474 RepID=UPI0008F97687|nr:undecaprenyldiphospho-muramoylpentapeptide beta-N-acetylglucosaminyltransferase [Bacillus mediterraneensis]